jgi:hypothetical protein
MASMKMLIAVWDIAPCSVFEADQRFRSARIFMMISNENHEYVKVECYLRLCIILVRTVFCVRYVFRGMEDGCTYGVKERTAIRL